jgi:hypothetical protein
VGQAREVGGVEGEITGPRTLVVWLKCPSLKSCHGDCYNGCTISDVEGRLTGERRRVNQSDRWNHFVTHSVNKNWRGGRKLRAMEAEYLELGRLRALKTK